MVKINKGKVILGRLYLSRTIIFMARCTCVDFSRSRLSKTAIKVHFKSFSAWDTTDFIRVNQLFDKTGGETFLWLLDEG